MVKLGSNSLTSNTKIRFPRFALARCQSVIATYDYNTVDQIAFASRRRLNRNHNSFPEAAKLMLSPFSARFNDTFAPYSPRGFFGGPSLSLVRFSRSFEVRLAAGGFFGWLRFLRFLVILSALCKFRCWVMTTFIFSTASTRSLPQLFTDG